MLKIVYWIKNLTDVLLYLTNFLTVLLLNKISTSMKFPATFAALFFILSIVASADDDSADGSIIVPQSEDAPEDNED